ncbi:MAG: FIST C-terminal domain-containing protein [Actinobacteria bacterium]|nr:FIST C-terminal domain-containing protein [Actinomycetota bacterium]
MFRMVVGHSDELDMAEAAATVLEQCDEGLGGEKPVAGLLFSTFGDDPETLISAVAAAYPNVIGSTSMGEMSSRLGFLEDSVVLALFVSDSVEVSAGVGKGLSRDRRAAVRAAVQGARSKADGSPNLCITTPDVAGLPRYLLDDLRAELGSEVSVIGGGAVAARLGPGAAQGRQFFDGRVLEDAIPLLLFSGPLVHSIGVDAGWRPVGKAGVVTRVSDETVLEIDGQSALGFYERYLGPGAQPTPATPLAVFQDGAEDFYLRVAFASEDTPGALRVVGGLTEEARVQIAVADTEGIFGGTRSAFQRALKGYPHGATPDAALLFACAVRRTLLGTRTGRELEIARNELGASLPIAGAYCLGEFAPLEPGAPTRFHNETMVALLLGSG